MLRLQGDGYFLSEHGIPMKFTQFAACEDKRRGKSYVDQMDVV